MLHTVSRQRECFWSSAWGHGFDSQGSHQPFWTAELLWIYTSTKPSWKISKLLKRVLSMEIINFECRILNWEYTVWTECNVFFGHLVAYYLQCECCKIFPKCRHMHKCQRKCLSFMIHLDCLISKSPCCLIFVDKLW